jgi:L-threonylcarbamoyladenylate synthase
MHVLLADLDAISEALALLQAGEVIAHATETCYGLACDIRNPGAVAKLFAIKERPAAQPVSALFESVAQVQQYVVWNPQADELARAYLPGPLTLILPIRPDAPHPLYPTPSGGATIGVRISSHPLAQSLVSTFGAPITTTSANIHGQPNPYSSQDITAQFEGKEYQPALILDSGTLPPTPPSTVMDLAGEGGVRRKGSIG